MPTPLRRSTSTLRFPRRTTRRIDTKRFEGKTRVFLSARDGVYLSSSSIRLRRRRRFGCFAELLAFRRVVGGTREEVDAILEKEKEGRARELDRKRTSLLAKGRERERSARSDATRRSLEDAEPRLSNLVVGLRRSAEKRRGSESGCARGRGRKDHLSLRTKTSEIAEKCFRARSCACFVRFASIDSQAFGFRCGWSLFFDASKTKTTREGERRVERDGAILFPRIDASA